MAEFRMPSLGAFMEAGSLVEWKVKPGDRVKRGDIVAVVDTDKAAIEIEIWQDGVVRELLARPGEKVPVGGVLAMIGPDGAAATKEPAPQAAPAPAAPAGPAPERVRASPAARQRARDLGVDLATVQGSGPTGAITIADVERAAKALAVPAAPAPAPPAAPAPAVPAAPAPAGPEAPGPTISPMRRAIAIAMERSNREIPHYFLSDDIDMTQALAWLEAWNWTRPVADRMLPIALLIKAAGRAAREVPELNGYWEAGGFRPAPGVHAGVTIALRQGGLLIPVIHDVPGRPLPDLMRDLAELTARARAGRLRGSDLVDATITVTSLGDRGADSVLGVIYPPQVALVGFGRVTRRPAVVEDGGLVARDMVTVSLAADHRASDGHRGSRFLEALGCCLQHPEAL